MSGHGMGIGRSAYISDPVTCGLVYPDPQNIRETRYRLNNCTIGSKMGATFEHFQVNFSRGCDML